MLGLIGFVLVLGASVDARAQLDSGRLGLESTAFPEQRQEILQKLEGGETYKELSSADRQAVSAALDRMQRLYENVGHASPTDPQQVAFFNDGQIVNALLGQARADSRVVCERVQGTGSRRVQRSCLTVAERQRRQRDAEDYLRVRRPDVERSN